MRQAREFLRVEGGRTRRGPEGKQEDRARDPGEEGPRGTVS